VDRVLRGAAVTISATWYDASGAVANPGTGVTVKVDREDGSSLVSSTAATGSGTAARTFDLTPTHTALLDVLKATWTSSTLGELVTYVEVAGGFLFSLTDARKDPALADTTKYPAADVLLARTVAETALEDACQVAFVPRYRREQVDGSRSRLLTLQRPRPLAVRSIKRDTFTFSGGQLAQVQLRRQGSLYLPYGWPLAINGYEVVYEHGFPYPPPRVGLAARKIAASVLVESPFDDRTTRVTTEGGTIEVLTAGVDVFDIPEANAVVREYGFTSLVG
jgi:hypothetical protein